MYETGMMITGMICGVIFLSFFIVNLIHISKQLINEELLTPLLPEFVIDFIDDEPILFLASFLLFFLFTMIVVLIWPLVLVGLIWYGIIYILRKFVRFKKKVNKALSGKDKPDHTHEWERE